MADHVAPALEAILMVAESRFRQRCWPSWSVRRSTRLRRSARTWRPSTSPTDEDSSWPALRGYRFQTATEQAPYVERFVLDGQSARLSAAALETLAVIAYKQPVSRNQIASIRGVNVDAVMRTLQQRGMSTRLLVIRVPVRPCCTARHPRFSSDSGSIRSRISRRSASSSRRLTWSRRSSGDCARIRRR